MPTSAPNATIFLIISGIAATCGPLASLSAVAEIFMLPLARAENLTRATGRLAADSSTNLAQTCVQVRKIAIRIRMTAITATAILVSVTNVRYVCS